MKTMAQLAAASQISMRCNASRRSAGLTDE
jgi:hypothetical protein